MKVPMILLTDGCTIKPFLGKKPEGPSYDSTFTSKCRFVDSVKVMKDENGEEFVSAGRFFLPYTSNTSKLNPRTIVIDEDSKEYVVKLRSSSKGFTPSYVELVVV